MTVDRPQTSALGVPRTTVVPDAATAERAVANEVCELVAEKPDAVLGLATGSTMVGVYAELVRRHDAGGLDLSRVTTFNLDEYLGLPSGSPQAYRAFMEEHLFGRTSMDPARAHVPDAVLARADMEGYCAGWERAIEDAGGLDLQLLGLGRNGHIAFNEPGSSQTSRTRQVELCSVTREDAAPTFGGVDRVPRAAITMGVATILAARRLRVLVFGTGKSTMLRRVLTDPVGPDVPGTYLRGHGDVEFWVDVAAAEGLDDLLPAE
jgi:glucosamine-6-phosphate deaminase